MSTERVRAARAAAPKARLRGPELQLTTAEAYARRSARAGPIEQNFFTHSGRRADKWIHYLPFYDRVLAPYQGRPMRVLEIGVALGGSLELWRKFFGPEAVIFGVDIDPECALRVDAPNQVRIGSQADPEFLRQVVGEMGGVDIVLDDGSHVASDQRASFETLWPLLSNGGLYMIEDMHTSYWPRWEGGLRREGTAVEMVKAMIDDANGRYFTRPESWALHNEIGMIFAADSIAAVEKRLHPPGGHVWAGLGEPDPERTD